MTRSSLYAISITSTPCGPPILASNLASVIGCPIPESWEGDRSVIRSVVSLLWPSTTLQDSKRPMSRGAITRVRRTWHMLRRTLRLVGELYFQEYRRGAVREQEISHVAQKRHDKQGSAASAAYSVEWGAQNGTVKKSEDVEELLYSSGAERSSGRVKRTHSAARHFPLEVVFRLDGIEPMNKYPRPK